MPAMVKCGNLTIPNGTALSNFLDRKVIGDARGIMIMAPAALDGHTVTLEVTHDDTPTAGGTWATASDGTADLKTPAAGKAISYIINMPIAAAIRLHDTGGNVGAARIFTVYKLA